MRTVFGWLGNSDTGQITTYSPFLIVVSISAFKELSFDVWVALTNYAPFIHNRPLFGQGQK